MTIGYIEDSFDLEEFKMEMIRKRKHSRQKNRKKAKVIILVSVLLMMMCGLLLLQGINAALGQWQLGRYQREVVYTQGPLIYCD